MPRPEPPADQAGLTLAIPLNHNADATPGKAHVGGEDQPVKTTTTTLSPALQLLAASGNYVRALRRALNASEQLSEATEVHALLPRAGALAFVADQQREALTVLWEDAQRADRLYRMARTLAGV